MLPRGWLIKMMVQVPNEPPAAGVSSRMPPNALANARAGLTLIVAGTPRLSRVFYSMSRVRSSSTLGHATVKPAFSAKRSSASGDKSG